MTITIIAAIMLNRRAMPQSFGIIGSSK
jgi:hypothetical protein